MTSKDEPILPKAAQTALQKARVQRSYEKLTAAAVSLNSVSDQLGRVVVELDAALKILNLGITSWIHFRSWSNDVEHSSDQIGYARIGGKWGIAIRSVSGNF